MGSIANSNRASFYSDAWSAADSDFKSATSEVRNGLIRLPARPQPSRGKFLAAAWNQAKKNNKIKANNERKARPLMNRYLKNQQKYTPVLHSIPTFFSAVSHQPVVATGIPVKAKSPLTPAAAARVLALSPNPPIPFLQAAKPITNVALAQALAKSIAQGQAQPRGGYTDTQLLKMAGGNKMVAKELKRAQAQLNRRQKKSNALSSNVRTMYSQRGQLNLNTLAVKHADKVAGEIAAKKANKVREEVYQKEFSAAYKRVRANLERVQRYNQKLSQARKTQAEWNATHQRLAEAPQVTRAPRRFLGIKLRR